MKRLTLVLCGVVMAAALVACAPITAPATEPIPATATPSAEPEMPMPVYEGPLEEITENVQNFVSAETGASPDEIVIVEIEAVDWPDGCLGVAHADEMCIQMITPGYRVVVEINGDTRIYHTNDDASHIRPGADVSTGADRGPGSPGRGEPVDIDEPGYDAAMAVRQMLMQQLQVDFDSIRVVAVEAVDWPDACLGAPNPDEMCAQMITSGYRVVLEVDGAEYVYHTDATGQSIRPASVPQANTGMPIDV